MSAKKKPVEYPKAKPPAAAPAPKVNASELVRKYPDMKPAALAAKLEADHGLSVKPGYINTIRYQDKLKAGKSEAPSAPKAAALKTAQGTHVATGVEKLSTLERLDEIEGEIRELLDEKAALITKLEDELEAMKAKVASYRGKKS